jgi:hypothetical protein
LLIDATMPNAGRVANYLDGGRDNFEADRKAAQSLVAAAPVIGLIAPAWHAFFQRVVRYLVREAGVRQFLHIATTLAASNYADEFIWSVDPGCRIAFVGSDPLVLAHARALMRSGHNPPRRHRHEQVAAPVRAMPHVRGRPLLDGQAADEWRGGLPLVELTAGGP